jgi:integrase
VSAGVIRAVLGMLQSMFRRAVEWGKASGNVVKEITKPAVVRKRAVVPLTPETVERIRRAMLKASPTRGVRDATLVSILGYTGMRPEEALALECCHLGERTILVEQKLAVTHGLGRRRTSLATAVPGRWPPKRSSRCYRRRGRSVGRRSLVSSSSARRASSYRASPRARETRSAASQVGLAMPRSRPRMKVASRSAASARASWVSRTSSRRRRIARPRATCGLWLIRTLEPSTAEPPMPREQVPDRSTTHRVGCVLSVQIWAIYKQIV